VVWGLQLWDECNFLVWILVSRGSEAVTIVFEENFGFGRKNPFSTRTMPHDDVERGACIRTVLMRRHNIIIVGGGGWYELVASLRWPLLSLKYTTKLASYY
jgi:hypothetical protein